MGWPTTPRADYRVCIFTPNGELPFAGHPTLGVVAPWDRVAGSLNAGVAQWLIGDGLAPGSYVAAQGTALGRAGRVYIEKSGSDIWLGGEVVTCVEGTVTL